MAAWGRDRSVYGVAMLVASVTLRYPTYQNAASNLGGHGVVRIVDDRNMDATSTKATRNQRYKSWVEEHGDPST